jgi:hypothetical protein
LIISSTFFFSEPLSITMIMFVIVNELVLIGVGLSDYK